MVFLPIPVTLNYLYYASLYASITYSRLMVKIANVAGRWVEFVILLAQYFYCEIPFILFNQHGIVKLLIVQD